MKLLLPLTSYKQHPIAQFLLKEPMAAADVTKLLRGGLVQDFIAGKSWVKSWLAGG